MKLKVVLRSDFKTAQKLDDCLQYLLIKKIPAPFHAFPEQQSFQCCSSQYHIKSLNSNSSSVWGFFKQHQ